MLDSALLVHGFGKREHKQLCSRGSELCAGNFLLPGGIVTLTSSDTQTFRTLPTFLDDNAVVTGLSPITTEAGLFRADFFATLQQR